MFVVDKVATYPKDQFPTDEVSHGSFLQSEIRLVKCGGPFDKVKHHLDHVIVFGLLTPDLNGGRHGYCASSALARQPGCTAT